MTERSIKEREATGICLFVSVCLFVDLISLSISMYLSNHICLSDNLSVWHPISLPFYLSFCLPVSQSICLCFSIGFHLYLSLSNSIDLYLSLLKHPKKSRTPQFLYTFDLQMCFVPSRRAILAHLNLNIKKRRRPVRFFDFNLQMCFAAQRPAFRSITIRHTGTCLLTSLLL